MNKLTIKDLARTEQLGRKQLAAVRGGFSLSKTGYSLSATPAIWTPTYDSSVHVQQNLGQAQQVFNKTADGSAFICGLDVTNNTDQFGQNNVNVH